MIDLDRIEEWNENDHGDEAYEIQAIVSKGDLLDIITRLRQAEKDAARYRWLRDVACHSEWHTVGSADPSAWDVIVDEYIDEAMQCNKDGE